jgi:hypothetical protein
MPSAIAYIRHLVIISVMALLVVACGPSKQTKSDLELLNMRVRHFVSDVGMDVRLGSLDSKSAERSAFYDKCIVDSHRLGKSLSGHSDILNALIEQESILERWHRVAAGYGKVTFAEEKDDESKLNDIKVRFSYFAQ